MTPSECADPPALRLTDVGVRRIVALRGDLPSGYGAGGDAGEFRYASDLVAFDASNFAGAKLYDYTFSFNGFAATLTPRQVARLAQEPNVVAVAPDERRRPLTDNTPSELGLTGGGGLWASGGPDGTVGEDVVIGVIDTGIWPEHPSFSDQADFSFKPGNIGRRTVTAAAGVGGKTTGVPGSTAIAATLTPG